MGISTSIETIASILLWKHVRISRYESETFHFDHTSWLFI